MNKPLKVVIVDDEIVAAENLQLILENHLENVDVVGIANGVVSGVKLIQEKQPDVVLLDIDMPPYTGFDLLEMILEKNFKIIFITAHDEHALKAFRYSATDYLLKPVVIDQLEAALERIKSELAISLQQKYDVLLENLKLNTPKKIAINTLTGVEFLNLDDIEFIKADQSYCEIHLNNTKKLTVTKPLKELDDILNGSSFFRSHKSYLINLHEVRKLHKDDFMIELSSGKYAELSRRRKQDFLNIMEQF